MKLDKSRKIGIVSGIGPLAGADVLERVFKHAAHSHSAVNDDEYPDVVLVSHGISEVNNLATLSNTFKDEIVKSVDNLIAQGANIIGIACNTAYIYLTAVRPPESVELVNLLEETAKSAAKYDENYLLLTSHSTRSQRLYHPYLDKHNVKYSEVDDEQQKVLDQAIACVMAYKLDEAGKLLGPLLTQAVASGFSGVVAGCTELPIAIDRCREKPNLRIIESNDVLAETLVDRCYK